MEQQLSLFNEMPLVSNHPFYDRKVFVRGFDANTRMKIREYVVSHGGEIVDNPSKNIQFVIMDNSVSPKLIDKVTKLTDDGFAVRWIGKPDFDKIVNGDYDAYMMPPKIQKKLNLTIERINKWKFRIEDKRNPFSLHEIFIGGKLTGNIDDISQMFGNLGSYANRELFPETDAFLISDNTMDSLSRGLKDETILAIEKFYDDSDAITFDYQFVIESDFLKFVKDWCDEFHDEILTTLYNKYHG